MLMPELTRYAASRNLRVLGYHGDKNMSIRLAHIAAILSSVSALQAK